VLLVPDPLRRVSEQRFRVVGVFRNRGRAVLLLPEMFIKASSDAAVSLSMISLLSDGAGNLIILLLIENYVERIG
jgi:hypothetical protein